MRVEHFGMENIQMYRMNFVQKIKPPIVCSKSIFRKSAVCGTKWKKIW